MTTRKGIILAGGSGTRCTQLPKPSASCSCLCMTSSWCTGPDNTYVGGQPTRSGQFHWHVAKAPRGLMVACPEKIAFHQGWINAEALQKHAQSLDKNGYGQYLVNLLK